MESLLCVSFLYGLYGPPFITRKVPISLPVTVRLHGGL